MHTATRIAVILCIIAIGVVGPLYLLDSANLICVDLLPLILVSILLISSAFLLCVVLVEIPLRTLEGHLDKKDAGGLVTYSNSRTIFSRLAALISQSASEAAPDIEQSPLKPAAEEPFSLFHDLFESAADAILLIDANGIINFCNKSTASLFGCQSGSDLSGKALSSLSSPEQQGEVQLRITEVLDKKQSVVFEITMLKCDGSPFNATVTLAAVTDEGGTAKACSVFLRDGATRSEPDDKKEFMEQQLRAVYKMEALGQLARGIAHDLNNNLGAISGYVDLLQKANPDGDARTQRYISMIASAAHKSGTIIHQLLTYARKNHMQIISFDVNEVIADIAKLLESSLEKNIVIVRELNAGDAAIVGDPGQIQNSIVNLAINASDAMAAKGGTLTFTTENVTIDEEFAKSRPYKMTHGYYLMITVRDTGTGMDKSTLDHLFEPFFTTKEAGKGTGLGLASVYGSLKSHHGYIEVDSEVSCGSTFTMYLPVNPTPSAEDTAENVKPAPTTARKGTIMVVDDDRSLVEMLGELLSWLGYSVTPFLSAPAAIEYYATHHEGIDLAILDWKMPEIDGMECYRRLKAINPNLKALLSTGYCLDEERQSILSQGVNGILPKPFMSAELSSAVAEVLA